LFDWVVVDCVVVVCVVVFGCAVVLLVSVVVVLLVSVVVVLLVSVVVAESDWLFVVLLATLKSTATASLSVNAATANPLANPASRTTATTNSTRASRVIVVTLVRRSRSPAVRHGLVALLEREPWRSGRRN
jgi:hypothetical protein